MVLIKTSERFSGRTSFKKHPLGLFSYWESVFREDLSLYNWSLQVRDAAVLRRLVGFAAGVGGRDDGLADPGGGFGAFVNLIL